MRNATLKWKASIALLALAVLGLLTDASAISFGRPRPTSRPHYQAVHEIPRAYELPHAGTTEQIKPGPVTIPSLQAAPHWEKVTQALGAQTDDPDKAYVVMRVGSDGNAWMTTNLVRGTSNDRSFTMLPVGGLKDAEQLGSALQQMVGGASDMTLKVLVEGSLSSEATMAQARQGLSIATRRFKFAELIETTGGKAYALELVPREKQGARWLARLNECCVYTGVPPDIANWQQLSQVPFSRGDLQVVSLFPDLAARKSLEDSGLRVLISHPDEIAGDVETALIDAFNSGPPGTPIAVVGHVTGDAFVVETANGGEISLERVSEMARQTGRPVYLLGCYTAEHYAQAPPLASLGFPVTTLSVMYPREVVERLGAAGRSASNLQQFTALVSSESLYVEMPAAFLVKLPDQRRSLLARIASVTVKGARAITGFFRADLPCPSGMCP